MAANVAPVGEDFYQRIRAARRAPTAAIAWLAKPVPLWPGVAEVMVHGVAWDADEAVRRYWLQLGRAANAGKETA